MNKITRRTLLTAAPASALVLALPEPLIAEDEPHPVLSLPFVRDTTRAERLAGLPPRIFWSVQPSGDYSDDCDTGTRYAQLALDYMDRENSHHIMQWAVFDMMQAVPEHSGIEVGFLSVFGRYATAVHSLVRAELST